MKKTILITGGAGFVGHPIKIHHTTLDPIFSNFFQCRLKKILSREKGRNPNAHYAYLYRPKEMNNSVINLTHKKLFCFRESLITKRFFKKFNGF